MAERRGRAAGVVAGGVLLAGVVLVGCETGDGSISGRRHFEGPGDHGPNCAAIMAAEGISFSGERGAALARIAERQDLNEHEQMYVINVVVDGGGFSADKARSLVALAENPALTDRARQHLSRRLDDAMLFSADRERVALAMINSVRDRDGT